MRRFLSIFVYILVFIPIVVAQSSGSASCDSCTSIIIPHFDSIPSLSYSSRSINVIIRRYDTYYVIDYCPEMLPDIVGDTIDDVNGSHYFEKLEYGLPMGVFTLEDDGYPALPFHSLNIQIPDGMSVMQVTAVGLESCEDPVISLEEIHREDVIYPEPAYEYFTSLSRPYTPANNYTQLLPHVLYYQSDYYSGIDDSWNSSHYLYSYGDITFLKSKGLNFQIFPFQYHPDGQEIHMLGPTRFYVSLVCMDLGNVCSTEDMVGQVVTTGDIDVALFFDNYAEYEIEQVSAAEYQGDYLIITQDMFCDDDDLNMFIDFKESIGFSMHKVCFPDVCNDVSSRINEIRNTIIDYANNTENLKYVLLVGTRWALPPSAGMMLEYESYSGALVEEFEAQASNPPTDIYYECYNATSDSKLFPRVLVGRWLLNRSSDIAYVVMKTIYEELNQHIYKVAVCSGSDDNSNSMQRGFQKSCKSVVDYFNSGGAFVNYYGADSSIGSDIITGIDYNDLLMVIFSGHGGIHSWGAPYDISPSDWFGKYTPFVFAFSCLTNSFIENSFGSRLLIMNDLYMNNVYGSSTYYGSSTFSYSSSDNNHIKQLFSYFKKPNPANISISSLLNLGEQHYYTGYKILPSVQNHIKRYNLFGDPSMKIFGLDGLLSTQSINTLRERYSINRSDSIYLSADNVVYYVTDIYGHQVYNGQTYPSTLQPGLYVIHTLDQDGVSVENKKLIVKP